MGINGSNRVEAVVQCVRCGYIGGVRNRRGLERFDDLGVSMAIGEMEEVFRYTKEVLSWVRENGREGMYVGALRSFF